MHRKPRKKGLLHKVALHFVPSEDNSYRPKMLRRGAMTALLALVLFVEAGMLLQIFAQTSLRDFLAAIFPASIVAFTNAERADASLGVLIENPVLQAAAQRKADDMAARGYFSHVGPDGKQPWDWMKEEGYDYRYAGENLAVNFYDSSDVVHAWMASPSHKANIVKTTYTEIGIGVADGVYQGRPSTFVVQFFGTPRALAAASVQTSQSTPGAAAPAPQTIVPEQPLAPVAVAERTSQVQGESDSPVEVIAAPVKDPSSKGASFISRILGSPRLTASWILSGLAGLLIVALLLTLVIRIQVQPLDLLATGVVAASFIVGLIALNSYFLTGGIRIGEDAASAVLESVATSSDAQSI